MRRVLVGLAFAVAVSTSCSDSIEPAAPAVKAVPVAAPRADGMVDSYMFAYNRPDGSWHMQYTGGDNPEGSYQLQTTDPQGISSISTGWDMKSWTADSLFSLRPTLIWYWNNDAEPQCYVNQIVYPSHTQGTWVNTEVPPGCPPVTQFLFTYDVVKLMVSHPVQVTITGPAQPYIGVPTPYTVTATGGAEKPYRWMQWWYSDEYGNNFVYICGSSTNLFQTCYFTLPASTRRIGVRIMASVRTGLSSWQASVYQDFYKSINVNPISPSTPLNPPSVSGPSWVEPFTYNVWSVTASGGVPPYTIWWYIDGQFAGAGPWTDHGGFNPSESHIVSVTVSDAAGQSASASLSVTVGPFCNPLCEGLAPEKMLPLKPHPLLPNPRRRP